MTTLNAIINQQDKFIQKEILILEILKFHKNRLDKPVEKINNFKMNRKDDLLCIISDELTKQYELLKYMNNVEHLWECLSEFAEDIESGIDGKKSKRYIGLKSNGVFSYFDVVPKKNRINISDATKFFIDRIQHID